MCKMQCKMLHCHIAALNMRQGSFIFGTVQAYPPRFSGGGAFTIKIFYHYVLPNPIPSSLKNSNVVFFASIVYNSRIGETL